MFAVFAFYPIGTTAREKISCEGNLSLRLLCKRRGRCSKRSGFSCFWQRWISYHWDPPEILSLGEELQEFLQKKVDIFEIREVNPDGDFYHTIMKEKVLVAWCNLSHTISFRVTDDEKHLIQLVLRGIASSDRFFLHQGSRPWPAWRGRELEEARSAYFESTGTFA